MTGYRTIATSVLALLTEVRLYEETIEHVIRNHVEIPAELPFIQAAVEHAIASPTEVERSGVDTYVFVDRGTTNRSGDPLRVPVKVIEGTSGRVRTFYFASGPSARIVVWRRGDG